MLKKELIVIFKTYVHAKVRVPEFEGKPKHSWESTDCFSSPTETAGSVVRFWDKTMQPASEWSSPEHDPLVKHQDTYHQ